MRSTRKYGAGAQFLMTSPSLRLVDVHTHLQMGEYDADRKDVIARSLKEEIGMIVVGTTLVDSLAAIRLAQEYPDEPVYVAVGVHPTDDDIEGVHPAQLHALTGDPKVIAIGECGLDYFRLDPEDLATRQLQQDVFDQHILLAGQQNLPLIIHCRDRDGVDDAYRDVLVALTRQQHGQFVMHCYSGTWAMAQRFLDLGGYLSFTGIITFPKSDEMQKVAMNAPLEKILVETDAPFLSPVPHRGKRNEPAYVEDVAKKIAELRGVPFATVAEATLENSKRVFGL